MTKARFRRAVARKNLFLYKSAICDLETVIAEDPASVQEATKELNTVRTLLEEDGGIEEEETEKKHPNFDDEPWDYYSDSETEDCNHEGNKTPCRFYNHAGCARGRSCQFSHAPDDNSVRDELGKNVCLKFLFNECEFGATKCIYSHEKKYLPAGGWWEDQEKVAAAKRIRLSGGLNEYETYEFHHSSILDNVKGQGFASRKHQEAILEHLTFIHENAMEDVASPEPNIPAPKGPFVLVLSFDYADMFTSIHTHLLNTLKKKTQLVHLTGHPKAYKKAAELLENPNLVGVLVADPAIVKRKYTIVLRKLVKYVKKGGSVVMGGSFSSHISPSTFDDFMKNTWGLNWKFGSYHRTTFALNPSNEIVKRNSSLKQSYSMKTVHVDNIKPEMAVYTTAENAHLQSLVFAPVPIQNAGSESPAVCARVGRGLLSFLGDVNAEVESTNTIMAMLGLLDQPNAPLPEPPAPIHRTGLAIAPTFDQPSGPPSKDNGKGKQKESAPGQPIAGPSTQGGTENSGTAEKSPRKLILIFIFENAEMFKSVHANQLSALKEKADVIFVEAPAQALVHLSSPRLGGVFIADDGLIKPSSTHALRKVLDYVKSGGKVVIGGLFSSMTNQPTIAQMFAAFGLPWKPGTYRRMEAQLNRHHPIAASNPTLSDSFSMKSVFLTGFQPEDLLYEQYPPIGPNYESAILHARVGKGQLGYIGDVNAEAETTPILLAMFDLLNPASKELELVPDSQKFVVLVTQLAEEVWRGVTPPFLPEIKQKAEVILGLSNARIVDLLSSKDLSGVLVADNSILKPQNAYLLSKLVEYSKNGGTVVFGFIFANQISLTQFRPLFQDNWGLDWNLAGTESSPMTRTAKNSLVKKMADPEQLPKTPNMDGIFIKGITQSSVVYCAQNRADLWKPKDGVIKSPVVFADVEKGHVGFLGVDLSQEHYRTIAYAMLGLI
ncbi:hypothetical protein CPB84DRAFT_1715571 [Gymnopilus junonius]|uniref:C3H1-type domain-containing protein n=1 Tax=Gymnopilus junonius TaxID=109634 RepID=A0A9P5N957_GYMJU|nr:hypothetical protein CPB84DRAFT_1715571 [Gymnopilus junonius]